MKLHAPGLPSFHPTVRLRAFVLELRRRRVLHTAMWYVGASVATLEAANVILSALDLSNAILRPLTIFAIFGFPVALMLSWEFDVYASVPAGDTYKKILCVIPVLAIALISLIGASLVWKYSYSSVADTSDSATIAPDPAHVAVLQFDVPPEDVQWSAFAYSLQTLLISGLTEVAGAASSQGRQLRVISERGIRPFSKGDVSLDSLRDALDVGTVLDGSVQMVRDRVRVRLNLVDTRTGDQVATSIIEKQVGDRIALADAVADSALWLVRRELGLIVRNRMRRLETQSNAAFNFYAAGMRRLDDITLVEKDPATKREVLEHADLLFAQAQRLDPRWIEPLVQRGDIAHNLILLTTADKERAQHIKTALNFAQRALAISQGDYRALELRGRTTAIRIDHDPYANSSDRRRFAASAERDLLMALNGNPNPAVCYRILGELAWASGRKEQAVAYGTRAYREDPYIEDLAPTLLRLFEYAIAMRRDEDAHHACREGRTRFTEAIFDDCRLRLAAWTRYALAPDSANDVVTHEFEIYDGKVPASLESTVLATYAAILARNRMPDSARTVLTRALRTSSSSSYTLKAAAGAYALLGETDSALVLIRKLLAVEPDQRRALSSSAELRHLESNPQFVKLVQTD